MKKIILTFLPFLCFPLIACEPQETEKDILELNNYKIVYDSSSNFNEDYIAKELVATIRTNDRYKDIKNEALLRAISYTDNNIYLKVDENYTPNSYSIKRNKDTFLITSDTNTGLIKAAKDFLNTINTRPSNNLYDWYREEKVESYESRQALKIMTYNVRVGNDTQNASGEDCTRATRAPRIAKKILQYEPDSVGVQEYSEAWKELLSPKLMPKYGYIGYGREETLTGESSGIFYNRDTVTLLKSGTKWLSETPSVPGSKFADSGKWCRIFTYGIFERHADNLVYLHVNTHFDLEKNPRLEGAEVINSFLDQYKDKMPIVLTGDFNNDKREDDAVRYLINQYSYKDCFEEDKDAIFEYTYPTSGYYKAGVFVPSNGGYDPTVIDYCLKPNKGFICEKYLCDTEKVSGKNEAAGPTSDHYPVYFELMPYDPFTKFNAMSFDSKSVAVNNTFCDYDHSFNYLGTISDKKDNHITLQAAQQATHNGELKSTDKSQTKYQCVGNLSKEGGYIEYKFSASKNGTADLVMVMASCVSKLFTTANAPTDNLSNFASMTFNDNNINIHSVALRNDDISQYYEWEQVVLKNVNVTQGVNTLRLNCKQYSDEGYYMPNQLLLEVFSKASLSFVN